MYGVVPYCVEIDQVVILGGKGIGGGGEVGDWFDEDVLFRRGTLIINVVFLSFVACVEVIVEAWEEG